MDSVLGKKLSSHYDMDLAHVLNMIYDNPNLLPTWPHLFPSARNVENNA
jgi:hypothetical protein